MTGEVLLADAERALTRSADHSDEPLVLRALATWLLDQQPPAEIAALIVDGAPIRSYERLAACALFLAPDDPRLADGADWLAATASRRGAHPAPVCLDAAAQLALATASVVRERLGAWLGEVVRQGAEAEPHWLVGAVRRALGDEADMPAEVRVALAAKGLWADDPTAEMELLVSLQRGSAPEEPLRAAFALASLRWIRRSAATVVPGRATVGDVLALLEGVTAGLAEWTWEERGRKSGAEPVRWDVTSEYHVQNLLWLVLRPVFPDLKKEEYVPSRGHHQPRTDLLIPSLRLVIEVKYLDKTGRAAWRERTEELKADVTGYLAPGSPADRMIVFLWDDTASTEQHETFRQGFEDIEGVVGVVVVARPGRMVRPPAGPAPSKETDP